MRKTLEVYKASTYVRLTGYKPELIKQILMPFCKRNFARVQKVPGELYGTHKWEVTHVFARFNNDKTELRFCASMLPELLKLMTGSGYKESRISIQDERVIKPKKVVLPLLNPKIKPRDEEQEEFCEFMMNDDPLSINNLPPGRGKAQPLTSLVKVPNGWKKMGDIQPGDKVTSWDGTTVNVLSIHPQGVKDIYEFTFADGRTAECTLDHLWKVFDTRKEYDQRWGVVDTKEIIRRLSLKEHRLYIPLLKPKEGERKNLILDPWVVGALIGDGGYTTTRTTFTNNDEFVVSKMQERLGDDFHVRKIPSGKSFEYSIVMNKSKISINAVLKQAGVEMCTGPNKHIPDEYMNGSLEQRWELLRGLMDTDGSADQTVATPCFNTSSQKLAKQVQELIWSLGGSAKCTSRIPSYTYKGEKKEGLRAYRVYARISKPKRCFSLPAKQDKVPEENQYSEKLKLRITSVKLVRREEAQCISIDHSDHLYVTDNYVVTHNTFCALFSAHHIGERILITVLPRFVDIWVKAFGEFYNIKPEDVVVADIIGVTELHQAIVNNVIDPKIIILPLTKIDIYLKKLREDESLPNLDQVFDDIGCGIRVIDEAHESIYSVYNSLMFGNHKRTFVLSGTLKGDDEFINKIYNAIFPFSCYLRSPEHTPYMHVVAYFHRMDLFKYRINTKGFGGYSHVKFEQGILKKPYLFESYYQMLLGAYKQFYLDEYLDGQKSMWFFATTEFCDKFNERLLADYPELDSIVFNSKTSKKDPNGYREHTNVVTTPGSCGTGKDIPKLFTVFSPIAVSSSQRNNQMVCRTRPVDKWWPDLMPYFVYFVCQDEKKQIEYGRKRRELFNGVCKKFSIIDSGVRL